MCENKIINFRPVYSGSDSCIFRSANIDHLSQNEKHDFYANHNIECHLDLRSQDEISFNRQGNVDSVYFKSFALPEGSSTFRAILMPTQENYIQYYKDLIEKNRTCIKEIISFIALSQHKRFLISCYAGKDRTGVIIALLLLSLGVSNKFIIEDYHKSSPQLLANIDNFKKNWEKRGLSKTQYSIRLEAQETIMSKFLEDTLKEQSVAQFFAGELDIGNDIITQLKAKFSISTT